MGSNGLAVDGDIDGTRLRRLHGRLGSDELPRRADVVVLGGGIVGLAAAYELAEQGMKVCLLDRSQAGSAQSTRNWGFIRQQGRSVEELPIMIEATQMWLELEKRLGCDMDLVQGGNLRLTDSPDRAEDYRRWIDMARSFGLDSRVARAEEVEQIMPGFAGRYLMAIFTPSDGQVNPVKAVAAYVHALRALDVEIYEDYKATAIVTAANQVVGVQTDDGFIGTSTVVLAAGAGSKALLRSVGLEVPIHFVGQTVALTTAVPKLTNACVWTGKIGFRQARSGGIVLVVGRSRRCESRYRLPCLSGITSPILPGPPDVLEESRVSPDTSPRTYRRTDVSQEGRGVRRYRSLLRCGFRTRDLFAVLP